MRSPPSSAWPASTAGALPPKVPQAWVDAVAADLQAAGARALVVAGEHQSAAVQVLAAAMNQALGAVGSTVSYFPSQAARVEGRTGTLGELVGDMAAGKVDLLLILDANPVYDAPVDLGFARPVEEGHACACTPACTTTRPPSCASGTCRWRTTSRAGATCARSTAPCRSRSR